MSQKSYSKLEELIEKPVDKIGRKIQELIDSKRMEQGDKLPSERILSEKFGVGRIFVRDAIRKLEFYGILKTIPKSGTVVNGDHNSAFVGLITSALSLTKPDYKSLVEARYVLEVESAGLAAERATPENIEAMEEAVSLLDGKVKDGEAGLEEDLTFHVRIAEGAQNDVNKYLISFLVSHMMNFSKEYNICRNTRPQRAYNEHGIILENIKNGDVDGARDSMRHHLSSLFDFIPGSSRKL